MRLLITWKYINNLGNFIEVKFPGIPNEVDSS